MDGVIDDFASSVLKVLGVKDYQIPPGCYDMERWPGIGCSTKELWDKIDAEGVDFWADIEKYPWADDLVAACEKRGDVFILTSPSRNPYCAAGKMIWVKAHYRRLYRRVIITPHKHLCSGPGRVLIDDSEDKIKSFRDHGGDTIVFPQPWNSASSLFFSGPDGSSSPLMPGDRVCIVSDQLDLLARHRAELG